MLGEKKKAKQLDLSIHRLYSFQLHTAIYSSLSHIVNNYSVRKRIGSAVEIYPESSFSQPLLPPRSSQPPASLTWMTATALTLCSPHCPPNQSVLHTAPYEGPCPNSISSAADSPDGFPSLLQVMKPRSLKWSPRFFRVGHH